MNREKQLQNAAEAHNITPRTLKALAKQAGAEHLTANQLALCHKLAIDPADFAKSLGKGCE